MVGSDPTPNDRFFFIPAAPGEWTGEGVMQENGIVTDDRDGLGPFPMAVWKPLRQIESPVGSPPRSPDQTPVERSLVTTPRRKMDDMYNDRGFEFSRHLFAYGPCSPFSYTLQKEIVDRYNDFVKHRSVMSVPCLVLLKTAYL